MTTKKVQVRAKFLRDYLAARGMHMMLFFEFDRWSTKTLDELGLEKQNEDRQEAAYRYVRFIDTWPSNLIRKTFARLLGKKVLKGTDNYRPALLWDRESQQYEDFTIGVDESRPTARRIGTPLASR